MGRRLISSVPLGAIALSLILAVVAVTPAAGAKARSYAISKKSASQILAMASAAETLDRSVRVSGTLAEQGAIPVGLNLVLGGRGDGRGTVTEYGTSFQILKSGTQIFVNASDAFWSKLGGATFAKLYGGKWVAATNKTTYAQLNQYLSLTTLIAGLFPTNLTPLQKNKVKKVNGQPAVPLSIGPLRHASHVLYVAARGTPNVTKVIASSGPSIGSFTFTHYAKPRSYAIPNNAITPPTPIAVTTTTKALATAASATNAKSTPTTRPPSTIIIRTIPPTTTTTFGVVHYPSCPTGQVTGTIVVNSYPDLTGYFIRATGTITNDTSSTVDGVEATWTVNYDGEVDTYMTPVAFGGIQGRFRDPPSRPRPT
jgi:hypothetical protein